MSSLVFSLFREWLLFLHNTVRSFSPSCVPSSSLLLMILVPGHTVMGEQSVQQLAEAAALWDTGADGQCR